MTNLSQSLASTLKKIKLLFYLIFKKSLFYCRYQDQFYIFQQDRFRGEFEDIKKRQQVYLKHIKKVKRTILTKNKFLDCGFGRGEFLELLTENKIPCLGVDINSASVADALKKKYEVYRNDAISFLYLSNQQFSGISSFHMIEHIKFTQLFDFLVLAYHKLKKGGILILETPNIDNIVVSSTTFYYDHTHIQKVSRELLIAVLKFVGFSTIQVLQLHPADKNKSNKLIYGAQDLGIIAYK